MEEIDLMELFKIFWSKKIQIAIIILVFMIIGLVYITKFVNPVYSASTSLLLASANDKNISGNIESSTEMEIRVNSKLVSTYRELIKSKRIIRPAIANLNIDINEDVLKKNIKVNVINDTELIEITVTNPDPKLASDIANEIASIFIKEMQEELYKIENVQVVDKAEPNYSPSNVNKKKTLLLFTGVGVIISIGYVIILNMFDTTIKTIEDVEKIYHKPVLATIPVCEENTKKAKKRGRK